MPVGNEQDIPVESTPSFQDVTDVGTGTTNYIYSTQGIDIANTGVTVALASLNNIGDANGQLSITNLAGTESVNVNHQNIRFVNNGFSQYLLPYPTIAATKNFTLPNISADKYIPVTVQINGTPTSANSSGVIDLGTISGGSGITRSINNISGTTTAGATASTDYVYFCTGTFTLTLPTCVGNTNRYTVKCISGTLTIACNGAETIDGTTTISVAVEDSVDIISNNTEWKIV